ncbi:MAG: HipA family kinase [Verrucomicrobiota bacterium]
MSVTIVSISGRAEKGVSRPFFCEGDDGFSYFVKSANVSADQLILEYLISRLAEECGLPVAPVQLLAVPEELTRYSLIDHPEEFRPGTAFGSQRVPFADELRTSHLRQIDQETKIRCLCFDWWTRNPDRTLGIVGGDPNLLWDPVLQGVVLIDHDRCLGEDFDETEFKQEHAFRDVRPFIEKSFFKKWRTKFESSIYHLSNIWEEIPADWLQDESGIARTSLSLPEIEASLIKPDLPADGILPG